MQQALASMRSALGGDAVIVATQESGERVQITAAVEVGATDLDDLLSPKAPPSSIEGIRRALDYHGVPDDLARRLVRSCEDLAGDEHASLLASALRGSLAFSAAKLDDLPSAIIVGASGAGKTATVARLAARFLIAGHEVAVLSADTQRTGGVAQLAELLQPMQLAPVPVRDAADLGRQLKALAPQKIRVLVDTPGVNPFGGDDLAKLGELVRASRLEPLLVLQAGLDPQDSREVAANFSALGCRRSIIAKLDCARRLGGIVAAAEAGLSLAEAATSPIIGKSMVPITAVGLARLLLATADSSDKSA